MLSLVSCFFSCSEQRTEKEYIVTYKDGMKDTVIGCNVQANSDFYYFSDKKWDNAAIIPANKIKSVKVRYDKIR
jgi:hypothetical protein